MQTFYKRLIATCTRLALLACCGVLTTSTAMASESNQVQRCLVIDPMALNADPVGSILLHKDKGRSLDLEMVRGLSAAQWESRPADRIQLGYEDAAVWLRVCMVNSGDSDRSFVLELEPPQMNWVDFYWGDGKHVLQAWHTGDQRPFSSRPIAYPTFAFPVEIPAGSTREAILRLDMRDGVYPSLDLKLAEAAQFLPDRQKPLLYWGGYYGIVLVLLAYNLLLYASTRDRSFMLYVIYLGLFGLISLGPFGGFGFQWLWPNHPEWNRLFDTALPGLLIIAATAFFAESLGTRKRIPRLHRTLIILTVAAQITPLTDLVLTLIPGIDPGNILGWLVRYFMVMTTVISVLYLIAGILILRSGYVQARFYVLAWAFTVAGILVHRLVRIPGLLPVNFLTENALVLATTIEFVLLALALGDRYNQIKSEAIEAQTQLYEEQRRNASRLEKMVSERTRQLRDAIVQVKNSLQRERRAQADQRDFLALVTHELRTPLAVINATAQNLERGAGQLDAPTRKRYERILKATDQLKELITRYTDEERFSILDANARIQQTDIKDLLHEVENAVAVSVDGHQLCIEVDPLVTLFPCDPKLTALALRSLVENAFKYTPRGSKVLLQSLRSGGAVSDGLFLNVVDSGTGLSSDELERVFEPHYRAANSVGTPGRGMGLSLARRMIESQGGTLTATQGHVGGTCFSIWLPWPEHLAHDAG